MSKLRAIAIAFSVTLLVLFATLIYLMTKMNPPEQEPGDFKPNGTAKAEDKFDDADYYLNSNEAVLSNDNNLRYGLEKVTGEYDVDAYSKMIAKLKSEPNNTEIPDLLANNKTQENCTRIRISKIELATQPVKGFRRSINEKELLENEEYVPIALLMKIKHLDGQPGIQFKLVSNNLKNQIYNTYKSSGNETTFNSSSKSNFEKDSANNSFRSASIVMAENGTFILSIFANTIDLIKVNDAVTDTVTFVDEDLGNETVSDTPSTNSYYENDTMFITDSAHSKWQTEIDIAMNNTASPHMYTYNLEYNNFTNVNISVTQNSINKTFATELFANDDSKNSINTDEIQQETSGSILREENEMVTPKFENESVSVADVEVESTIVTENVDKVFVSDKFNNSSSLVGLLIQESTANLPID